MQCSLVYGRSVQESSVQYFAVLCLTVQHRAVLRVAYFLAKKAKLTRNVGVMAHIAYV